MSGETWKAPTEGAPALVRCWDVPAWWHLLGPGGDVVDEVHEDEIADGLRRLGGFVRPFEAPDPEAVRVIDDQGAGWLVCGRGAAFWYHRTLQAEALRFAVELLELAQ